MASRVLELLALAEAGDDEVQLLVESEFALMPETKAQRMAAAEAAADEFADTFAVQAEVLDDNEIEELASQLGF